MSKWTSAYLVRGRIYTHEGAALAFVDNKEEKHETEYQGAASRIHLCWNYCWCRICHRTRNIAVFTEYGKWATLTILLSCLLFVWLGTKMMLVAHDTGAKSYEDLNSHLFGKNAGKWISFFTLFVLIGVNSVILAGAGSVFMEHLHLSYQTGLLITLVGTYLLLGRGIHAILQMNSIVVPLMMTLSLFILFHTTGHPGAANFVRLEPDRSMFATWLSPILYSSFNLAMAQAILVPLGSQITDRRVIKYGGILGESELGSCS